MDWRLVAFWVFALLDWWAVARLNKPVEYVAKPATLIALLAWAATQPTASPWLLAALFFSLLGDIFLMLPVDLFVAGLGSFLVGHIAYLGAFTAPWPSRLSWLFVVLIAAAPVAWRLLRSVPEPQLRPPVAIYVTAISAMVASALASGHDVAIAGALLFLVSDLMLGWDRFVRSWSWARIGVIVTYHLGQLLLATSLVAPA